MLWIIEDLRRATALHDLAAVEHDGLVGELTYDGQVVSAPLIDKPSADPRRDDGRGADLTGRDVKTNGPLPGRNFRSYPRNLWTSCA